MLELTNKFNEFKKTNIPGCRNFTWHDALYLPTIQAYAQPTIEQMANIIKMGAWLENLRANYNTPIIITSWLRPNLYNQLVVKGATFSMHRTGLAVDFIVDGLPSDRVRADIKADPKLQAGASFETGISWVHVQLDNRGMFFPPPPKGKGLVT